MSEGVDPRQSHPVLSDDQLIEEGQVHAVDQTPMEGIKEGLEVLFVSLFNLQVIGHIF